MKREKEAYFYIIPALVIIFVFVVVPVLTSLFYSFTDARILTIRRFDFNFVGFSNYWRFFQTTGFKRVMVSTFLYLFGSVVFVYIIGLFVALLLNQKLKLRPLIRGIVIIPWAIPQVVMVLIWRWMLNSQFGIIKYILESTGIVSGDFTFLGDANWAMFSVILVTVWRQYPIATIMLLSGLKTIPEELYEASSIDGANYFQKLLHITLPNLKYISSILILLLAVWSIGNFVIIWLLTGGGPADSTAVLSVFSYLQAFKFGNLGYGAAIGAIGLIISLLITAFYYRLFILRENI
jgi:multiple sugar transport system permease protein